MAKETLLPSINTNPSMFEELAQALASAIAYMRDRNSLQELQENFEHLYRRALRQPPCYNEVNELTGQCLNAGDRLAGRAAWMLVNVSQLRVYGVHSLLWNEVHGQFSSPLLDQMALALGRESQVSAGDLRHMSSDKKALIDVVGIRGDEIWIVQTISKEKLIDSALAPSDYPSRNLIKMRVFHDPVLRGQSLRTLYKSAYMMRKAFPDVRVQALCLVQHATGPDFELYRVDVPKDEPDRVKLTEPLIVASSIDFSEKIQEDHDALLALPQKLDSHLFVGLPPCRAGRTLGILASTASRQIASERLLTWREGDIMHFLEEDFGYKIPRDKVRHDLGDRLAGNGFMKKYGSDYSLTMKGLARYLYCLAKYTTRAVEDPTAVLSECMKQRDRTLGHYGCL